VLAVGEHLWDGVDDQIRRMTTGLAGGIGCSEQELCGVLSGGTLIIGSLYGRTSAETNDDGCQRLVCEYRERFIAEFGTSRCADIRASGYGSEGIWPCSVLVGRAARILLETLADSS
jgi:C_GCAxxG_C_C family probable redox protein